MKAKIENADLYRSKTEGFEGVIKVRLPLGGSQRAALIYPQSRAWVVFIPTTPELRAFIEQDKMWGGVKTYAIAKIKGDEVELTGIAAGETW